MRTLSTFLISILAMVAVNIAPSTIFASGGFVGSPFMSTMYFAAGGTGSGHSSSDPADIATAKTVMTINAGMVVTSCDVVVQTAITGSSPQVIIGDDDSSNGFMTTSGVTEGSPAWYVGDGSYVASGIAKYYSAAKSVLYTKSGTLSAGKFVIIVRGYSL